MSMACIRIRWAIRSAISLLCAGVTILGSSRDSRAQLLAYEQFQYPAGTASIHALNGGAGWAGPWSGNLHINASNGLHSLSNSYPLPVGQPTAAAHWPAGGFAYNPWEIQTGLYGLTGVRSLATPLRMDQDGVVYFSFLIRRTTVATDQSGFRPAYNNMRIAVSFLSGGSHPVNDAQITVGADIANTGANGETLQAAIRGAQQPGTQPADDSLMNDTTFLIAGKVVMSASGYDQVFYERYRPGSTVDAVEPAFDKYSRPAQNNAVVDRLCVFGEGPISIDEIRVGATWESVTTDPLDAEPPGSLQFAVAGYSVTEDGGNAVITVRRAIGSAGAVSVDYATGGGTATAGVDYTATSGTLNFADGQASQSFTVPVLHNAASSDDVTVGLTLSNPGGGAALGGISIATLLITNTDTPAPNGVALLPASDTGVSDSDYITHLNNSGPDTTLALQVTGTLAGAVVTLYDGTTVIGSATATGTETDIVTNGTDAMADGVHFLSATQTEPGSPASPPSANTAVMIDTTAPALSATVSRKVHGAAGVFDLPLNVAGGATVEPRLGGPATVVFTFDEDVVAADGWLDDTEFAIAHANFDNATAVGAELTLGLAAAADQSNVAVTLNGLTDIAGNPFAGGVVVSALYGDVNRTRSVTISDLQAVKNQLLRPLSAANYLCDVNLSGSITISDMQQAKNNLLHNVPPAN